MKKKIGILHPHIDENATEDEKDVLVQVKAISKALRKLGFNPVPVNFDLNLEAVAIALRKLKPAFVFNLVEAVNGCGSLIHLAPALLDHLEIPYTGSGTEAMFITSNKIVGKKFLETSGIATPKAYTLSALKKAAPAKGRYIVKSVWEHASIGMSQDSVFTAKKAAEIISKLEKAEKRIKGGCFCEEYIDGREINAAILASPDVPQVLPPAEILFVNYPSGKPKIVDYRAKWVTDSFEYLNTDRSFDFGPEDKMIIKSIKAMAIKCWDLLKLKGYARVDFRVDESGKPWVLEINANPCLSSDGGFAVASALVGLDFPMIIKRIIDDI
jgi:D-alanine-D-alanine ligase